MLRLRSTSALSSLLFIGGLLILAAPSANAQNADMTFPRDALDWYLAGDTERLWEHLGPMMRQTPGGAAGIREGSAEIREALGAETSVIDEQMFPHPEDDNWSVYVRASRHANTPEMFWIVVFLPSEPLIQLIMPQPRQTIRTLFPAVRLP